MTSAAGRVEHDALRSGEPEAVPSVRLGPGLHARELVAGLALGEAERDLKLPGREPGEPFALDGAALLEEARAHHHRCEVRLDGEAGPERLHHDRGLHRTAAHPARVFRECRARASPSSANVRQFSRLNPVLARGERAPGLERILGGEELLDALAQELLFVR